ncbi:RRQRL motif-containing zinc-binding protein [Streptomyces daliensis]
MSETIPSYAPRTAPDGLATKRQLDAVGLRPGGHDPVAQLEWPGGSWAALYDITKCLPKRPMTDGRRRSVEAMLRARRICPGCGLDVGYVLSRRIGLCGTCTITAGDG